MLRGFRSLLARPWSTTPEGKSRHRVGEASGLRRKIDIMATKTRIENAAKPSPRNTNDRKLITLEMALALCPNAALADNLSTTFGLDPVDAASIRETTEEHVALAAKILPLSDKALEMHLQRIVGGFVGSAYGAGQFYCVSAWKNSPLGGVRPCGWTESSGSFDHLLGVSILELHRAEVS